MISLRFHIRRKPFSMVRILPAILGVFLLLAPALVRSAPQSEAEIQKIYQGAMERCIAQKWDEALEAFRLLTENYPASQYHDDAYFWIGYCLEKKPDSKMEAFLAYDDLKQKYPESLWVDDAILHQISLAENFVRQGQAQYLDFLHSQLGNAESNIREQAAISLGKLGDKAAIPELRKLFTDKDLGPLARSLVDEIESGRLQSPEKAFQLSPQPPTDKKKGVLGSIANYFTRDERLYKTMLKKDNQWSQADLIGYALWIILPIQEFEEYASLDSAARQAWYLKEWKEVDPTPDTPRNEAREEFERRIQYAREHFTGYWPVVKSYYLPLQHQVKGWLNAPWDARGELYIKYGEPDVREIDDSDPLYTEHWIYYKFNVDFTVRKYMTNIYGQAIGPGYMSRVQYRSYSAMSFIHDYVDNKEFYYP